MENVSLPRASAVLRESSLDMIKVIATILIIFHHYAQSYSGEYTFIKYYDGSFYFGYLVELFFVISGYCSLHMLGRVESRAETFPTFLKKRTGRLIPMLMITAAADQVLQGMYLAVSGIPNPGRVSLWGAIISGLGIQTGGAFLSKGVNNPTWYVSVLLICYVFMFFLTWLSRRINVPCWYLFAGMVIVGASSLTYSLTLPFLNFYASRGYLAFFYGILLGKVNQRYELHKQMKFQIVNILFQAGFWFCFIFMPSTVLSDMRWLLTFLVWPGMILLLKAPVIEKFVHGGLWNSLAKYSFNAYVWHSCLLKVLTLYTAVTGQKPFYSRISMLIFTAAAFLLGVISYRWIETPIAKRLARNTLPAPKEVIAK